MTSSQTLGVESFVLDHQIPFISPTASSPLLSGQQDCIFRLNPSSDKSAAVMAKYAYTHLEKKRVAVLYDIKKQAYSLPYALSFINSFKELGSTIPLQNLSERMERLGGCMPPAGLIRSDFWNMEGLMGTLRFDENGDVKRPYFVSKIIDGDFEVIGAISD